MTDRPSTMEPGLVPTRRIGEPPDRPSPRRAFRPGIGGPDSGVDVDGLEVLDPPARRPGPGADPGGRQCLLPPRPVLAGHRVHHDRPLPDPRGLCGPQLRAGRRPGHLALGHRALYPPAGPLPGRPQQRRGLGRGHAAGGAQRHRRPRRAAGLGGAIRPAGGGIRRAGPPPGRNALSQPVRLQPVAHPHHRRRGTGGGGQRLRPSGVPPLLPRRHHGIGGRPGADPGSST